MLLFFSMASLSLENIFSTTILCPGFNSPLKVAPFPLSSTHLPFYFLPLLLSTLSFGLPSPFCDALSLRGSTFHKGRFWAFSWASFSGHPEFPQVFELEFRRDEEVSFGASCPEYP